MRNFRVAILSGFIASLVAISATGQQRLSDIAGTVKLKQPPEGQTVISNQDIERAPQAAFLPDTPYGKCLSWKLDVFGSELEELRMRVSNREFVARILWYEEFLMQCDVIIGLADDFSLCTPEMAWQSSGHQDLMTAVDACRSVVVFAKNSSEGDKYQLAANTYRRLGEVIPKYGAARRKLASYEVPPEPVVEPERVRVPREIGEFCRALWRDRPENQAGCVREQENAFFALTSRDADEIGLSLSTFMKIRSECVNAFKGDYKLRDDCERKMIRVYGR